LVFPPSDWLPLVIRHWGYTGIGSKYYDVVTEQIEITVRSGAPWICELFTQQGDAPGKQK